MHPDQQAFEKWSRDGFVVRVWREILADRLTPVSAFERLVAAGARNAFLLESVERGDRIGRYSYLGCNAARVFATSGSRWTLTDPAGTTEVGDIAADSDPVAILLAELRRYPIAPDTSLPPLCGGAVGYLAYDAVRHFESLPDRMRPARPATDCEFLVTDTVLAFDHVRHAIHVVAYAPPSSDTAASYARAAQRVDAITASLRADVTPADPRPDDQATTIEPCWSRDGYCAAVERCREYIRAGDAFQIVLSQRMRAEVRCRPFDIYRALRSINPSPYMFYLDFADHQLIGSSPEILATLSGMTVRSRPIAGTRERGSTEESDAALQRQLANDTKEVAEHIMLVDLARNDLGRICRFGSVRVRELMAVERYSHVMHLVSDVVGQIRAGVTPADVLRATFPHGTVSGAPKIRAMQIIDELEQCRRGFYAGCVGYVTYEGDMDMAIAIRTMLVEGSIAWLQAGAGIVADSVPAREHDECINKMRALAAAIDAANRGLD